MGSWRSANTERVLKVPVEVPTSIDDDPVADTTLETLSLPNNGMTMRTLLVFCSCLILCVASLGCGDSSSAAASGSSGDSEGGLTTEQLTAAMGIRHWKYKVPDDIGDKLIAVKLKGGPTPTITGGIGGWQPGEVLTICVRSLLPNNALECTLISDRGYSRSMINNSFLNCRSVGHAKNGTFVGEDPMIKGNLSGQVSMEGDAPDDISLMVSIQELEPETGDSAAGTPPETPAP